MKSKSSARLPRFSLLFVCALLVAVGGLSTALAALEGPEIGKAAPDFTLTDTEGNTTQLSALKGKVVVLVFWASWCPHCVKEMPRLQEKWTRWQKKGVQVIAVTRHSKGQTTEVVQAYIEKNALTYPVVVDPGATSRSYNVSGIPAAVWQL